MNEDKKTVRQFDVTCYDTDVAHYLKPGAFMDLAQEIAYVSADSLGFGYDALQKYGTAWVLSRFEIQFRAMPRWKDSVRLETWHKGFEGPFYVRDFRMTGADGRPAVLATSSWLIIDVATRRLLRREHLEGKLPLDTICDDAAVDMPCPKLVMPKEGEMKVMEHRVAYSDVDIIGHTNNARYAVWAMDCIDFGFLSRHRMSRLRINFNRETLPGEVVELFRAPLPLPDNPGFMVEGRVDGHPAFVAEMIFEK